MNRHSVAVLVALSLALSLGPHAALAQQLDPHAEKIKREVTKIGVADKISVLMKKGGAYHGVVTKIAADSFELAEVDLRQTLPIRYEDVEKVRSGYGGINLFTGNRTHHSRGARIAATIGALFVVIGLPVIILATTKD